MKFEEVRVAFESGEIRQIDMLARKILNLPVSKLLELSKESEQFNSYMRKTNEADRDYLTLAHEVNKYLTGLSEGSCVCTIVKRQIHAEPSRLSDLGILEINDSSHDPEKWQSNFRCTCNYCGKKYLAEIYPSGFGHVVEWAYVL